MIRGAPVHIYEKLGMVAAIIGGLLMISDKHSEKVITPVIPYWAAILLSILCVVLFTVNLVLQSGVANLICPIRTFTISFVFIAGWMTCINFVFNGPAFAWNGLVGWMANAHLAFQAVVYLGFIGNLVLNFSGFYALTGFTPQTLGNLSLLDPFLGQSYAYILG